MSSNGPTAKGRQHKRPTPLRMVKPEEVRQYRPPVIIHTYSPKVHHVDAAHFSTLVQNLTGRPGLKRKPDASPKVADEMSYSSTSTSGTNDSGAVSVGDIGFNGLMSPRSPLASFEDLKYQPWDADQSTRTFTNNAVRSAATLTGPQYSPLFPSHFSPHLFSSLPSPSLISSNFMADLPALSPSTYQPYDAFGNHSLVVPPPSYNRMSNAFSQFLYNRKAH